MPLVDVRMRRSLFIFSGDESAHGFCSPVLRQDLACEQASGKDEQQN